MAARVLDGKWVRDRLLAEARPRVERLPRRPGIAVVLAGNNPASEVYVRNKVKACEETNIYSEKYTPGDGVTTEELLALVESLNAKPEIDGILVQMPLPKQVDTARVLMAVSPEKDVDGFHPLNVGYLSTMRPGLRPCTPSGVMEMLRRYEIPVAGKNAVVVGRSDIVGKPMAMLLLNANATVTVCHSKTANLSEICRRADILVAAIGRAAMITAEFIGEGATVIDVGMNRTSEELAASTGRKPGALIGDVHPVDVVNRAAAYTPVPGGVGPLTIAMLMINTIQSSERRQGLCTSSD